MSKAIRNVLFLCTGNTARSILAEGLLRALGGERFAAFSAGSQPKGVVNPFAIQTLSAAGMAVDNLTSKSWDVYAGADAPIMDFIITVCDNAAGETCPYWPGHALSAHWGIADPAAVEGADDRRAEAFQQAFEEMRARISAFIALPFDTLSETELKQKMAEIGRLPGATRADEAQG